MLGKGDWGMVFPSYDEGGGISEKISGLFSNEEALYREMLNEVAWTFAEKTELGYFKELVHKIFIWCGEDEVCIHSDTTFWVSKNGFILYKETGTRYKEYPIPPQEKLNDRFSLLKDKCTRDAIGSVTGSYPVS